MLKSINLPDLIRDDTQSNEDNSADDDTNDAVFQECDNVVSVEGLRYVAGYVAYKYRTLYPDLSVSPEEIIENDWIKSVAKGGLKEPSEQLLKTLQLAEQVFRKGHGEFFC
ncbi:hypothetical protein PR048_022017 [Dryococelus australis]|uniref:Uncharacterized protein n=1 Tax=Dryococelus australis TaxID=614101 RepID=A0ABQ9GZV2_9NEOP|nr:hypothetical protein PR048_022017 [Dryococelus australis]